MSRPPNWLPVKTLVWFVCGAVALTALVVVPVFLLNGFCSSEATQQPVPYRITEKSTQTEDYGPQPAKSPVTIFSRLEPSPRAPRAIYRSQTTEYAAPEPRRFWNRFWCEINGADYTLALFTIILALSTIALWYVTERTLSHARTDAERQAKQMRESIDAAKKAGEAASKAAAIAEKTLIFSDRPWVQIKAEIAGPLQFSEEVITVDVNFTLLNIGGSPAAFVVLFAELHTDVATARRTLGDAIRHPISPALLGYGNIIFPNDPSPPDKRTLVCRRAEFIRRISQLNSMPSDDGEEHLPITHLSPAVSAVVFYTLANDPNRRPRFTTMILSIGRKDAFKEVSFDGNLASFSQQDLVMEQSFLSGEAS